MKYFNVTTETHSQNRIQLNHNSLCPVVLKISVHIFRSIARKKSVKMYLKVNKRSKHLRYYSHIICYRRTSSTKIVQKYQLNIYSFSSINSLILHNRTYYLKLKKKKTKCPCPYIESLNKYSARIES